MVNDTPSNAHERAARLVVSQFPPEIQAILRDHARLVTSYRTLIARHEATFAQYRSLHAAMIALLKRTPDRTIRLATDDFAGVLFDEYVVQLHEDAENGDLVFELLHKSDAPGVEFTMPTSTNAPQEEQKRSTP